MQSVYFIRRKWKNYEPCDRFLHKWKLDERIDLWNRTFNIKYAEFRTILDELRQKNRHDIREIDLDAEYNTYHLIGGDQLVFPTDDDDWFRDDIVQYVKNRLENSTRIVRWKYDRITSFRASRRAHTFESNNFALRTPFERKYLQHVESDHELRNAPDQLLLDEVLAIHNFNLSSASLLREINNQSDLLEMHRKFMDEQFDENEHPAYFAPFVRRMFDLYRELRPRRVF
jgi:hypothetical protein